METVIPAVVRCRECGSQDFRYPTDPKPDDAVACAGCGATWRFDEFQRAAVEQAQQAVLDALRSGFGKGS